MRAGGGSGMKAAQEVYRLLRKMADGSLHPDEPLFVLRAQDKCAAQAVLHWCNLADSVEAPEEMTLEAEILAGEMEDWPFKGVPGLPETRTGEPPPVVRRCMEKGYEHRDMRPVGDEGMVETDCLVCGETMLISHGDVLPMHVGANPNGTAEPWGVFCGVCSKGVKMEFGQDLVEGDETSAE